VTPGGIEFISVLYTVNHIWGVPFYIVSYKIGKRWRWNGKAFIEPRFFKYFFVFFV